MLRSELTAKIKKICLSHGFLKVGAAEVKELSNEKIYLEKWLSEKKNADMHWLASTDGVEKRIDPTKLTNGHDIKSVISLAYLYDTPFEHSEDPNIPKVSRYAWGKRDYHKVLKKILKEVCTEISLLDSTITTRAYVDDGPVMEKVWAQKAGIGWQGKHTNILNKDFGSFFFLCEIFINKELDYDEPVEDLCKSCRLCLESCPTGAIYEEYKLDANLCISYQTIENRGEIPDNLDLNGWIFGCDICQDVCPYNSAKIFTSNDNFFPRKELMTNNYEEDLSISEEEFNNFFEGTPVRRTKYAGWIRNLLKAQTEREKK